jgi:hypothetical protein
MLCEGPLFCIVVVVREAEVAHALSPGHRCDRARRPGGHGPARRPGVFDLGGDSVFVIRAAPEVSAVAAHPGLSAQRNEADPARSGYRVTWGAGGVVCNVGG